MIGRTVDNPIYIIGNITGASRVVIPKSNVTPPSNTLINLGDRSLPDRSINPVRRTGEARSAGGTSVPSRVPGRASERTRRFQSADACPGSIPWTEARLITATQRSELTWIWQDSRMFGASSPSRASRVLLELLGRRDLAPQDLDAARRALVRFRRNDA